MLQVTAPYNPYLAVLSTDTIKRIQLARWDGCGKAVRSVTSPHQLIAARATASGIPVLLVTRLGAERQYTIVYYAIITWSFIFYIIYEI